jgi:hypothetical protein
MRAAAIAFALKQSAKYLRSHPELVKQVSDRIPGKVDDYVIRLILGV